VATRATMATTSLGATGATASRGRAGTARTEVTDITEKQEDSPPAPPLTHTSREQTMITRTTPWQATLARETWLATLVRARPSTLRQIRAGLEQG